MRRFHICAAVVLAGLALVPAFAAGKKAAPRKAEPADNQKIIQELYSITPASAPDGEEFKATPVNLPADMHVGVSRDALSVEMGSVMLNPIPNRVGSR